MFNDDTNIYARCRRARGITQEYAAELLDIAADGKVDELEKAEYEMLLDALEPIIQAAMTLRIAAGG